MTLFNRDIDDVIFEQRKKAKLDAKRASRDGKFPVERKLSYLHEKELKKRDKKWSKNKWQKK